MRKYILALVLFPSLLFAENNGDSLKFEIIKATVNFYTTDSIAYYKYLNGKLLNCTTVDYNCITLFCNTNDVGSILKKVEDWKKEPSNSAGDLLKLSKKITDELLKKDYRKKLDSFQKYIETVGKLSRSFTETKVENDGGGETTDKKDIKSEVPSTSIDDDKGNNSKSSIPLIALILGGLGFIISIVNFLRTKNSSSVEKEGKSNPDYHILKDDIIKLNSKLAQKQMQTVDLKPLEDKIKILEGRISNIENQARTVELQVEKKVIANKQSNEQPSSINSVFAKLPDTGNGFSQSIISNNQNGEQIYEIEINGDKATFSISDDPNAQKYALSDFNYYLSNACDFLNQPVKNCRIYTIEKGSLIKSGSNWAVQNKAKIEFK